MSTKTEITIFDAIDSDDADKIRELISAGADVNIINENDVTPLEYAAACGKTAIVRLLVELGADISTDDCGNNILQNIECILTPESLKTLIELGADVNAVDEYGYTPLLVAAGFDCPDAVRILIDSGANVNVHNWSGDTPLHAAASSGNTEIVQLLVSHGALLSARDCHGATPLHVAGSINDNGDVARILVQLGADIEATDEDEHTPLYYATIFELPNTMSALIDMGANQEIMDNAEQGN